MATESEMAALFEDFPELLSEDAYLEKELLAHFGLIFSAFANLEAGLHNCYVFWKLKAAFVADEITSQDAWESAHERLEREAFKSTFGTLLKKLKECDGLAPVSAELEELKRFRDYFAHHFFREENGKMFNDQARLNLIAKMNALRVRVKVCENTVQEIGEGIFRSLYPTVDIDDKVKAYNDGLRNNYIENPPTDFGWEKS